tara:strand:+ start:2556 stop:3410 length:855 start_codon:yes stop_codon:yes gene_type:complete
MKPLFNKATNKAWSISQKGLTQMMSLELPQQAVAKMTEGQHQETDQLREWLSMMFNQRQPMSSSDGIATVHAFGPMMSGASPIELAMGGTGYEEIIADLQAANSDDSVKAIVIVSDTPGGMVDGIKEVNIAMDDSDKPIYGYNAGMATSAGYHILAGTKLIAASPSSTTGNIGCVLAWYDDSAFLESLGFKMEVMTNEGADLKGTFRDSPMTDSQREFLQDGLNVTGDEFFEYCAGFRSDLDPEVKRAGWYSPAQAADMGLIDMVGSLSDFVGHIKESLDIGNN